MERREWFSSGGEGKEYECAMISGRDGLSRKEVPPRVALTGNSQIYAHVRKGGSTRIEYPGIAQIVPYTDTVSGDSQEHNTGTLVYWIGQFPPEEG